MRVTASRLKILCDKAGIPCVIAVGNSNGGGHAWNYVKMEDGKWYGVDCTFDDQGSILYDYFLVGTASGNRYFGASETFGSSHTETGKTLRRQLYADISHRIGKCLFARCTGNKLRRNGERKVKAFVYHKRCERKFGGLYAERLQFHFRRQ